MESHGLELFSRIPSVFSSMRHLNFTPHILQAYFGHVVSIIMLFAKVTLHPSPMQGSMVPILEIPEVKPI